MDLYCSNQVSRWALGCCLCIWGGPGVLALYLGVCKHCSGLLAASILHGSGEQAGMAVTELFDLGTTEMLPMDF